MKRPAVVIACGALIVTLAMGVRQTFGLFLPDMSAALDIGRGTFGLALALQNLLFGLVQPFVGAIADRHGAGRVVAFGAILYALGLIGAAMASSALGLHITFGVIVGMAQSATTFVVVLGAVGRVVPEAQRSLAFGIVTAGGSLGQFLIVPASQMLLGNFGYQIALMVLAGFVAVAVALSFGVAGKPQPAQSDQPLGNALAEAASNRSFQLLTAGFFVCGFHIAFIATHFPAYLADKGLGAAIGATVLALVGLFNIFGSYIFGLWGDHAPKKLLLSGLYAARGLVIVVYLLLPVSTVSSLVFAAAMGFLWLGTVPLTSGLIGQIFGVRYLSMLYGIVFLSHQVGSFFGAWMAGVLYDITGNYDAAWGASIALAVIATLLHLPIRAVPVARLQPA
ncbi:MFS transporter [Sphingosinicella sp.]|jgi:MFS family permease|uniref:MFS transporter n=1 Tax=Sphingosinicella sp. TaxID=1917971 RepID=UPI001849F079|nr:MFS transporter [Sphingosinicella sp.]MBA4756684.1 MFS transporter [Sphingosinicella sp.]MEA3538439.1 MFS transporter [Pseudomonadota bacterium]